MDVHYLATEYGIVNLKQKSVRERALALISIAHPKFRDSLLREAESMLLL
jgi:itaconate CoA-transferase